MKSRILSLALLAMFGAASTAAFSAPVKLSKAQMDKIVAGTPGTVTYSGPYGQIKNGNYDCNNCSQTYTKPGNGPK